MPPNPLSALPSALLLLLLAPTLGIFNAGDHARRKWGGGGSGFARAQTVPGRWGQSSLLLTPDSTPTLLIISGKSYVAGQTLDSTPTSATSLFLSLSSPLTSLTSPSWTSFTGPQTLSSSAVPLTSLTGLVFGGDATGSTSEPVQTLNDSSWLLSFPSTSSTAIVSTQEATGWANEPERREMAYAASATNGTAARAWVYGGTKADGSAIAFNELWEVGMSVSSAGAVSGAVWAQWSGTGGPPAMYDGTAVLVPSTTGGEPAVYLIGGVQVLDGTTSIASLASIWVFTPTATLAGGSWSTLAATRAPVGRRGLVAVEVGEGKIWIQGGRSLDEGTVYGDAAELDTSTGVWTTKTAGSEVLWGHSAVVVGETVVLAFGYGTQAPAASQLRVYAPANDTWLDAYYPSYSSSTSSSSSSSSSTSSAANSASSASTAATAGTDPAASSSASTAASSPWTIPGGAGSNPTSSSFSSTSTSSPPAPENPKDQKSSSTPVGGVVGGVLGAAVVAGVAAALLIRRRRRRQGSSSTPYYGGRRPGGGRRTRSGEGSGSLMAGSYGVEQAHPVEMRNAARGAAGIGEVRKAFGALLGRGASAGGTRFDMLRDEESDRWDSTGRRGEWEMFELEDGEDEMGMSGRGGMGVWEGFGTPGGGGRSETVQSTGSFLSGALGGFVRGDMEERRLGEEEMGEGDKGRSGAGELEPILEWDEERSGDVESSNDHWGAGETTSSPSVETHNTTTSAPLSTSTSSNLHSTLSGRPSTFNSSGRPRTPPDGSAIFGRPSNNNQLFSPPPSLRGSLFSPTAGPSRSLSTSTRTSGDASQLKRNSSWWARLAKPQGNPAAFDRIRDPTPAPVLGAITESSPNPNVQAPPSPDSDPFVDDDNDTPQRRQRGPDEHGRWDRLRRDASLASSNGTLDTLGSAALEERMRGMDVVQLGSASGSEVSVSSLAVRGHGLERTSSTGGGGEEMPAVMEDVERVQSPPPLSPSPDPFADPEPTTPTTKATSPFCPLPASAPLPPLDPPLPAPAPARKPTGVKALVRQIETRSLSISDPPPSSPVAISPAIPASTSFPNVRKATLGFEGVVAGRGGEKRAKGVAHGLVRKPVLYVANPDGGD